MTVFIRPALAFSLNTLTECVQLNTVHSAERWPNASRKKQQKQGGWAFIDSERQLNSGQGVQNG